MIHSENEVLPSQPLTAHSSYTSKAATLMRAVSSMQAKLKASYYLVEGASSVQTRPCPPSSRAPGGTIAAGQPGTQQRRKIVSAMCACPGVHVQCVHVLAPSTRLQDNTMQVHPTAALRFTLRKAVGASW